jgi:hypothetical protein
MWDVVQPNLVYNLYILLVDRVVNCLTKGIVIRHDGGRPNGPPTGLGERARLDLVLPVVDEGRQRPVVAPLDLWREQAPGQLLVGPMEPDAFAALSRSAAALVGALATGPVLADVTFHCQDLLVPSIEYHRKIKALADVKG